MISLGIVVLLAFVLDARCNTLVLELRANMIYVPLIAALTIINFAYDSITKIHLKDDEWRLGRIALRAILKLKSFDIMLFTAIICRARVLVRASRDDEFHGSIKGGLFYTSRNDIQPLRCQKRLSAK
jgi:hypothetical protein